MCGIIAIVRRPSRRPTPLKDEILVPLRAVEQSFSDLDGGVTCAVLRDAADELAEVDSRLRGVPGLRLLLQDRSVAGVLAHNCDQMLAAVQEIETTLESDPTLDTADLERRNHELNRIRDALWAITRDRLRAADSVAQLSNDTTTTSALEAFLSVHQALASLDRLEVRGRDSAGIHLLVRDHTLDLDDPALQAEIARRSSDDNFGSGSVRVVDWCCERGS